jgi:TonB family protein
MSLAATMMALMQAATPAPVLKPDWERLPPPEAFIRYYPKAAQEQDIEGVVTVQCSVTATGMLEGCSVVSEDPVGQGFGAAAMNLTSLFRMRPKSTDGKAVAGGVVRVPIRFRLVANLSAGPLKVSGTGFNGVGIVLDCRFRDHHLDNCFKLEGTSDDPAATEAALKAADAMTLPPLAVEKGRMRLSLILGDPPPRQPPAATITAPDWARIPTAADIARFYPDRAMRKEIPGTAVIACKATKEGLLADCVVVDENPPYEGFGEAGLKLTCSRIAWWWTKTRPTKGSARQG